MATPRIGTSGEIAWLKRAAHLRTKPTQLARLLADQDYDKNRKGLVTLANSCNACPKTFRVKA